MSIEEMNAFFWLLILAGVEKSWDVPVRVLFLDEKTNPMYKAAMSINRFEDIRKIIRFDDKRTREARAIDDKLAPIRYIWDLFIGNCRTKMVPEEFLTIDEQLLPFRGRCGFIQYMPSKPAKYGVKIFWLCESKSAYAIDGIVYTGRKPDEPVQKNVGMNIVKQLAKSIEGTSRNITTENLLLVHN